MLGVLDGSRKSGVIGRRIVAGVISEFRDSWERENRSILYFVVLRIGDFELQRPRGMCELVTL